MIYETQTFSTPIYSFENKKFLELDNIFDNYINYAIKRDSVKFKNKTDFGWSYHSEKLTGDTDLTEFQSFIEDKCFDLLNRQGYDLSKHKLRFDDFWVQQFSKSGGGHQDTHIHGNSHMSGFYFLRCSEKTSFVKFHDPRPAKMATQLPEKNEDNVTLASKQIHIKPMTGHFVFFNSYLPHQFTIDDGTDDFRFVHFNVQAITDK